MSQSPLQDHARKNALAEIQFGSMLDVDTPSEDDTAEDRDLQPEDAQSVIGVSIGQAQTHLASPKTPAAEKAAALEDIDGGGQFDGTQDSGDGSTEQRRLGSMPHPSTSDENTHTPESQLTTAPRQHVSTPPRMPSPWRAGPKKFQKLDDHRTSLRDTFTGNRRRTLSGSSTAETFKKYMTFNMPSMPKSPNLLNFSIPSFFPSAAFDTQHRGRPSAAVGKPLTQSGSAHGLSQQAHHFSNIEAKAENGLQSPTPAEPTRPGESTRQEPQSVSHDSRISTDSGHLSRGQSFTLRRSASENSLVLYRNFSIASSLGDDTRFEHVQEQVNSRLKAIKDSFQDANFKLPSIPSFPNFNLGSVDDFFKNKNNNTTPPSSTFSSASGSRRPSAGNLITTTRTIPRKTAGARTDTEGSAVSSSAQSTTHPFFTQALEDLTGDVVILGGYRGSVLRSAEPPHRQLWVPIKVGLNLRKVDLEVGLNPEDEETAEQRVIPDGMLTNIGPVDIAKRLLKRLRHCENAKNGKLRIHNYGYDWRLSPHLLSRKLIQFLKTLPCNAPGTAAENRGAIVIAHSLGGLITRHAINQQPELVAGVVYAGVPQTCVNILGPLRNGDDVLLSSRVLTAQVNFTIRTSYALLPLDGKCFFNKHTKEEYPVDFFNVQTWKEYRLSPCIGPALPAPNSQPNGSVSGSILNAMSRSLPGFPTIGRRGSISKGAPSPSTGGAAVVDAVEQAGDAVAETGAEASGMAPQMNNKQPAIQGQPSTSPSTTVTIPHQQAVQYLTRTLSEVKQFKQSLAFNPAHDQCNRYPPIALIYGKSTPTVYGAKVESREAIKRADAYDELAFASGDGVVLARAAMVPEGYSVVRGGVVSSDRGHVTLLGDLEAVGRCLNAVIAARKAGVGLGKKSKEGRK